MVEVVIGGVQKCGTSALHKYMQRHPQILPGHKKELHFFDDPEIDWNNPDYSIYEAMFPTPSTAQMRLDASPSYIYLPHCLERLRRYNPNARLIFIFRDPIERAWSHWSMIKLRGYETLDFDAAVHAEKGRLASYAPDDIDYKRFAYVDRGRYGHQFARALKHFSHEQILCLCSDTLRTHPEIALARVADHLGISPFEKTSPIEANKGPGQPIRMTNTTRDHIRRTLSEDIRHFSELSGVDTRHWEIFRE